MERKESTAQGGDTKAAGYKSAKKGASLVISDGNTTSDPNNSKAKIKLFNMNLLSQTGADRCISPDQSDSYEQFI